MAAIGNLEDLTKIRMSLGKSANQLKSYVEKMVQDGEQSVSKLRAELSVYQTRLDEVERMATQDPVTGVANRYKAERQLQARIERARNLTVAMFDLDNFKQINDRYGHRTGDLYLQEVTRRMKLQLRADDVLARIGGDEFIALVPILRSHADAEEIASRLEHCFDEPFELDGYTLLGSASVGLAVYPEDGTTKEGLQRSADVAMYANKETRKRQDKLTETMQRMWNEDVRL